MKKLIYKVLLLTLSLLIGYVGLFFIITNLTSNYNKSYVYVINRKVEYLKNTHSPKIIIVGGSSGAFGINEKLIEESTGLKCVNLSLHADLGMKFQTELSKANIGEGDIVIIAYENLCWGHDNPVGELILNSIDDNIQLYKYIPKDYYSNVIKSFPAYAFKKLDSKFITHIQYNGLYSGDSFDSNGNMTFDRPSSILPTDLPVEIYGEITLNRYSIDRGMIDYVNQFNSYVKNKNATLLISFCPSLKDVIKTNQNDINEFQKYLSDNLDAPVISNINNYIYDKKYFYDTVYHLNNEGANVRTKQLIKDISEYNN